MEESCTRAGMLSTDEALRAGEERYQQRLIELLDCEEECFSSGLVTSGRNFSRAGR